MSGKDTERRLALIMDIKREITTAEAIDWSKLKPLIAKLIEQFGPMLVSLLVSILLAEKETG